MCTCDYRATRERKTKMLIRYKYRHTRQNLRNYAYHSLYYYCTILVDYFLFFEKKRLRGESLIVPGDRLAAHKVVQSRGCQIRSIKTAAIKLKNCVQAHEHSLSKAHSLF